MSTSLRTCFSEDGGHTKPLLWAACFQMLDLMSPREPSRKHSKPTPWLWPASGQHGARQTRDLRAQGQVSICRHVRRSHHPDLWPCASVTSALVCTGACLLCPPADREAACLGGKHLWEDIIWSPEASQVSGLINFIFTQTLMEQAC